MPRGATRKPVRSVNYFSLIQARASLEGEGGLQLTLRVLNIQISIFIIWFIFGSEMQKVEYTIGKTLHLIYTHTHDRN